MSVRISIALSALLLLAQSGVSWATCKRPPDERYEFHGDTFYDKGTDLTWKRCPIGQFWTGRNCGGDAQRMTWTHANQVSHGDWRLPTNGEFMSLVGYDCEDPAINVKIANELGYVDLEYWSGTPYEDLIAGKEAANYISLHRGKIYNYTRRMEMKVLLVRSGR
ncbi:Lcl C-terminal domain-containing protein [Azospirillum agricola]|uniref:Lcl C-terminal domain-containing protein n=1 Tax=Azospirillum agricola TaxID=1720247 RepID=UPI000A0F1395|nr:Protein of unknown function [Azospirillum lipoferum]